MAVPLCDGSRSARRSGPGIIRRQTRGAHRRDGHHDDRRNDQPALARAILTAAALTVAALALSGCVTTQEASSQQAAGSQSATPIAYRNQDTNTPLLSTGQDYRFAEINADRFRPWSNTLPSYRVGPGDKLKIKYFITRDMDEELTVGPDGTIAPRAIGQMRVDGSTLAGIESAIRRASRKELTDQKVVVSLEEAAAPRIYVGGMVEHPGIYRLENLGTSVLQGIVQAGGFNEEARTGQVALIRRGPRNEPMLKLIDARQIIETGFSDGDVPLMAGDIIFVPRSNIAELNLWIEMFINRVVPFQRTFSYTVGNYTQHGGGTTSFLP